LREIIVSVGTSLLTNRVGSPKRPWCDWTSGSPLPDLEDAVKYLRSADPKTASAETNTLHRLGLQAGDMLHWLHSDTLEGEFCAKALCTYYMLAGRNGALHAITGLKYEEKTFASTGLRSLVSKTFEIIRKADCPVEICATGGFKAEMAYLNLVGLLAQCPVHYIHEKFGNLISLPVLPVDWDFSVVEDNIDFFEWIEETPRRDRDVKKRVKAAPALKTLVTYEKDCCGYLSAARIALYQSYKSRLGIDAQALPSASTTEPWKKIHLQPGHHTPHGWEKLINKLAGISFVESIYYRDGVPAGKKVDVVDPEKGKLSVAYGPDGNAIEVLVETTARSAEQCEYAVNYIRKNISLLR